MNSNNKKFIVVVGGDGVGKTSALAQINKKGWRIVSYNDGNIPQKYEAIRDIAKITKQKALPQFAYLSAELRAAYYNLFVTYLYEQIEELLTNTNVVCDSYYYKFLAKEVANNANAQIHHLWKNLRQPDKVIYLHAPPEVAFDRISETRPVLYNEVADASEITKENFVAFQNQIKQQILRECQEIPLVMIDASKPLQQVAAQLSAQLT